MMVVSIAIFFAASMLYECKIRYKLLFTFIFYIDSAVCEYIVNALSMIFQDINYFEEEPGGLVYTVLGITTNVFLYITIIIIKFIRQRKKNEQLLDIKSIILMLIMPITTVIMLAVIVSVLASLGEPTAIQKTMFTAIGFLLFLSNIAEFELLDRQSRAVKNQIELEFLKENMNNQIAHYESIYNSQQEIRKIKHDSKNVYTAVLAQIKSGNINDVEQYLTETIDVLSSGDKIVDTNHPTIDSVIQSKLKICEEKGIKTDFQYFYNEDIIINEIELAVVIGNLLDNAIEANDKVTATKFIHTLISVDNREINIDMKNPNAEINSKLQTTKNNAKNHGFGIKSVSAIAEKYGGAAKFSQKDNVFTAYVNLKNS